jgi:hypothetical protein
MKRWLVRVLIPEIIDQVLPLIMKALRDANVNREDVRGPLS